jgi:Homeodomain-like domain
MAAGAYHRQAGYPDSMASKGIPTILEMEVSPGRPRIPQELRQLIADMVRNNPSWGEERIASELLLKIGIQISPRTVRRYMPNQPRRKQSTQSWMTFVRNHAKSIIACDFFVVVTAVPTNNSDRTENIALIDLGVLSTWHPRNEVGTVMGLTP